MERRDDTRELAVEVGGMQSVRTAEIDRAETTRDSRLAFAADLSAPWMPALLIAVVYGIWVLAFLGSGHDARALIRIGSKDISRSHVSSIIRPDPHYRYEPAGRDYDGQYYYFIAVDPLNARYYLDSPTYRYTRIVYPMAARVLAVGRASAVPIAMIVINWFAMTASVFLLGLWLRRRGLSSWLALIYGLYSGLFLAFTRDLTEPLAFTFALLAVMLLDSPRMARIVGAGIAFGLAALTRETAAVFGVIYAVSWLWHGGVARRNSRIWIESGALMTLTLVPLMAWKAFLVVWLGPTDASTVLTPDPVPFRGLFAYYPWDASRVLEVACVVIPGLVCGAVGLRALVRGERRVEVLCLVANVLLFVVFLNKASYFNLTSSGRISAGVVLAALLSLPRLSRIGAGRMTWLWVCAGLWTFLTPALYIGYLVSGSSLS
ncbi:MAG TPA: hypothetical protein VF221_20035 [Chloroflexota bacterium]